MGKETEVSHPVSSSVPPAGAHRHVKVVHRFGKKKKNNIAQRISVLSRSDGVTALPASATVSVDGSRALGVTGDGDNQPAAQVRQTSFNLEPNQVKTRANTAQG